MPSSIAKNNASPYSRFGGVDDRLGSGDGDGGAPVARLGSERDQFKKNFPGTDDDIPSESYAALYASTNGNGFMTPNVDSHIGSTPQENSYRTPSAAPGITADPYGIQGETEESEGVRR